MLFKVVCLLSSINHEAGKIRGKIPLVERFKIADKVTPTLINQIVRLTQSHEKSMSTYSPSSRILCHSPLPQLSICCRPWIVASSCAYENVINKN